ncbi:hypothetical protein [Streptomyces adelaidensis]|uniref:hypothetical protein n=1 Tax=Streptomyces adelaidensis TaxID=2796465 RepID=UPI0019038C45|nr:hypothetical protein [Streptomyces adelaidensis]
MHGPVDVVLGGVQGLARDLQPPVHPGEWRAHGCLRLGAYARFFHERACRESAHCYISGRFAFMRLLAVRDN